MERRPQEQPNKDDYYRQQQQQQQQSQWYDKGDGQQQQPQRSPSSSGPGVLEQYQTPIFVLHVLIVLFLVVMLIRAYGRRCMRRIKVWRGHGGKIE